MSLALVRIDDRLVHGQVVLGWIPFLKADLVLVASQAAAQDPVQVTLMSLALPAGVALEVLAPAQAARHPGLSAADKRRVLVLVPGPREAIELVEAGVPLSRVNVGGMHYTAGKVQLGKAVFLSAEDKEALRELSRRGAALEGRALPGDAPLDLSEALGAHA